MKIIGISLLVCILISACNSNGTVKSPSLEEGDSKGSQSRNDIFFDSKVKKATDKGTMNYWGIGLRTYGCNVAFLNWMEQRFGKSHTNEWGFEHIWNATDLSPLYPKPFTIVCTMDSFRVQLDLPKLHTLRFALFDESGLPIAENRETILPWCSYFQNQLDQLHCASQP